MAAIGGDLLIGNSKLLAGPLGVVQMGFRGYNLGKTTADTTLAPDADVKDILIQQEGTKAADHVRTGVDYLLTCTFGEISTALLVQLQKGVTSVNTSTLTDSATIGRSLYQSMRETEAGVLRVIAVDENGIPSEFDEDRFEFYEAIPIIQDNLINWGADTQRGVQVQFRIKWHRFATPHSYSFPGAFGYYGDPVDENLEPAVWPDVEAPTLVSATATSATNIDVVFNENIAFQTAYAVGHYVAKVNGVFVDSSAGVISTTTLSLTFPAATFAAGNIIELNISEIALQDTEATPNTYGGADGIAVVNNVP